MKPGTIEDIREPFAECLWSAISFTLPHWLSRWETNVRSLRASLPFSELSREDQSILYGEFTENIALNSDTDAVQFHDNHVTGTMKRFFSGSKALTRGFKNGGLLEPETRAIYGIFTIGMKWLYTRNLIYLHIGIEPFREVCSSTRSNAISQMETFIRTVGSRIEQDIFETSVLHDKLNALWVVSSRIHETVPMLMNATNKKTTIIEGLPVWEWLLYTHGRSKLDDYIVKQQIDRLGLMTLVFGHASQYLAKKTVQLRAVQSGLHDLMGRWQFEYKGGSDASSWFAEQVRATDKEVQELQQSWLIWSKKRKDSKSSFLVRDCSFWVLHGHSLCLRHSKLDGCTSMIFDFKRCCYVDSAFRSWPILSSMRGLLSVADWNRNIT